MTGILPDAAHEGRRRIRGDLVPGLDVHKDSVVVRVRCVSPPLIDEMRSVGTQVAMNLCRSQNERAAWGPFPDESFVVARKSRGSCWVSSERLLSP